MATGNASPSWGALAKGLVVFAIVVALICWAVRTLLGWAIQFAETLGSLDVAIVTALVTGTVSIVTVVGGSILSAWLKDRRRRQEYLRDHRVEPYERLIAMFYRVLEASKGGKEYTQDQMLRDSMQFNQELTLWGSAAAIQKWNQWRLSSVGEQKPTPIEMLHAMEAVLIQLRIDMGETKGLKKGDLLRLFINDLDEG